MPHPNVTIRDLVIIATTSDDNPPSGEAYHDKGIMTAEEHNHTLTRLSLCINELINLTYLDHIDRNKENDPHYITRLSTHEFFFYTSEPLSIQKFETLQQRIIEQLKLKTLQPGLQFILGSFAVKTENNEVMNVTPHLASGNPPQLYLVVKNFTSSVDIFYKDADQYSLPVCNKDNFPALAPYITLEGKTIFFTLNSRIPCITADGSEFTTLVDICFDHTRAVSKQLMEEPFTPLPQDQSLSHVLISNSTYVHPEYCVGPIVHVDPMTSSTSCKSGVNQESKELSLFHSFGKDKIMQISLAPSSCLTPQDLNVMKQQMHDLVNKILQNSSLPIPQKITKIIAFLTNFGDINATINQGVTPLYIAAAEGYTNIVQTLLDAGAYIEATATCDKTTPLFIAAQNGHTSTVLALLEKGATVDLTAENGATPLFIAAQNGHLSTVLALLKKGANIDLATRSGATPLFIAAQNGHLSIVLALLKAGATVDLAAEDGATPLFIAAQNGHFAIVLALLKAGATVDLAKHNGTTPLFIAAQEGYLPIVKALLKKGAYIDAIHHPSGATPLYTATQQNHIDIVKLLLKHGAKENGPFLKKQETEPLATPSVKSDLTAQDSAYIKQQLFKFQLAYIKYYIHLNPKYTFINEYKKLCNMVCTTSAHSTYANVLSEYIFSADNAFKKALGVDNKSATQILRQIKQYAKATHDAKERHEVKVTIGPRP